MPDEPNIASLIHDQVIGHAVDLQRVKESVRREIIAILQKAEVRLIEKLRTADPGSITEFKSKRIAALIKQIQATIATSYGEISDQFTMRLAEIAKLEGEFAVNSINDSAFGVELASTYLSATQLKSIASNALIEGAPSRDWWERQSLELQRRFVDTIRSGMVRGLTTDDMVRDIRGTAANNFGDGIMETTRRGAEALVRTSVQSALNDARTETYKANDDVVKGIQWVSTLDNRTTPICRALDGLMWDLDYKPIGHEQQWPGPTAHWNCRSTQISVLKSWAELSRSGIEAKSDRQSLADYFEKSLLRIGVDEAQIPSIIANSRASMDGQVSRDITFEAWLKSRSDSQQNKILGITRAEMFRDGKVSLTDLVDQGNRPLTLDQLAEKMANERNRKSAS